MQVQIFYQGLNAPTRAIVDVAARGALLAKTVDEAFTLMEEMATNSYQWLNERSGPRKVVGLYEVDQMIAMHAQLAALQTQMAALPAQNNPTIMESVAAAAAMQRQDMSPEQAQFMANCSFTNNSRSNNMPNYYHLGLHNHENFSYANNKNVLQPPPGFNSQQQQEKKKSLEDILGLFIMESNKRFGKNEARLDNIETHMTNMGASMKKIETQVGQLAIVVNSNQKGSFPSDTVVNPKESCQAISLRSSKVLDEGNVQECSKEKVESVVQEVDKEEQAKKQSGSDKTDMKKDSLPMYQPPIPYPQRFQKKKLDEQFAKFLEIFKRIHINIPFADALEQMPNYKKLPQKVKDPGSFTIPCTIGGSSFDKALCDLGASINLMPLSIFKKLGVGEVKPTTITLQLADRSLTYPRGVIEDVLVKVDKFIFTADFLVLDMEEDHEIPIILGRPFLATGRALIDVQGRHLTLRVNNEDVKFNIYQALKQHDNTSTCHRVDSIEVVVEETMRKELCADPLQHCLNSSITQSDLEKVNGEFVGDEVAEFVMALSAIPSASGIIVE
ncbi:uncharacterized protein LOC133817167 [Humulus lupulus]|uniref:uncharacterized protein LOC133817167 n=1 Tax=Humulus lupulus TaxID=3486 RepID=UPI002B4123E3|nr:uncharacterized protein LOC133817167 [Humulus lupulus]